MIVGGQLQILGAFAVGLVCTTVAVLIGCAVAILVSLIIHRGGAVGFPLSFTRGSRRGGRRSGFPAGAHVSPARRGRRGRRVTPCHQHDREDSHPNPVTEGAGPAVPPHVRYTNGAARRPREEER